MLANASLNRALELPMMMPMLAVCLAVSLLGAPDAKATDDPYDQTNGVYVGSAFGDRLETVTIELRGSSMLVLAPSAIAINSVARWELAGPGGKGGDLQYKTTGTLRTVVTRSGKARQAAKKSDFLVRLRLWPERKEAVLCVSDPRKKLTEIPRVPAPGATGPIDAGITCYELQRVSSLASSAPIEPAPAPPVPDFECMRECRQQNMMRAVGPEVIDADCRAACTSKP